MATPVLTAHHRCDRCDARAYVKVNVLVAEKVKDCDLLFCAHHFQFHEAELARTGTTVLIDQRADLKETVNA